MHRFAITVGLFALLAIGAIGCKKPSDDPCERLYDKMSRCKAYTTHKSMEEDRKIAFFKDCRANYAKGDRLGRCLKMSDCAFLMISCRNSQDKPRGKDVRGLHGAAARALGGN